MATTITPTSPISTLAEALSFLTDVSNDIVPTLTENEFTIEFLGKSYGVRKPLVQENPRRVWNITVFDNGAWPGRTDAALGYQWDWETAITTIKTDITRFFPSVEVIDTGLYLHLDASVAAQVVITTGTTDEVEQLLDLSGNGFDTDVQAVSADRPRLVLADLNGLNVLSFDGTSQHLILPLDSFREWTLFVVGKRQTSATSDRGTFVSAMGKELTFGGMDAYVLQSAVLGTEGVLQTYVDAQGGFLSTVGDTAADTYAVLEWAQTAAVAGVSDAGIDGTVEVLVDCMDTRDDVFDSTRQPDVEPTPVTGVIGRTNAGVNAGFGFHYLEGSIAEIALYNRRLSDEERETVRAGLQAKWQV